MICLNSMMELIGRISTMLRMLRASTPVESFCKVVRSAFVVRAAAVAFVDDDEVKMFNGLWTVDNGQR